jgi:hypothetical protein
MMVLIFLLLIFVAAMVCALANLIVRQHEGLLSSIVPQSEE